MKGREYLNNMEICPAILRDIVITKQNVCISFTFKETKNKKVCMNV